MVENAAPPETTQDQATTTADPAPAAPVVVEGARAKLAAALADGESGVLRFAHTALQDAERAIAALEVTASDVERAVLSEIRAVL